MPTMLARPPPRRTVPYDCARTWLCISDQAPYMPVKPECATPATAGPPALSSPDRSPASWACWACGVEPLLVPARPVGRAETPLVVIGIMARPGPTARSIIAAISDDR